MVHFGLNTFVNREWKNNSWITVVRGHAIGHMKIDRFAPVNTSKVRLNILASAGTARIREFQLFDVG